MKKKKQHNRSRAPMKNNNEKFQKQQYNAITNTPHRENENEMKENKAEKHTSTSITGFLFLQFEGEEKKVKENKQVEKKKENKTRKIRTISGK